MTQASEAPKVPAPTTIAESMPSRDAPRPGAPHVLPVRRSPGRYRAVTVLAAALTAASALLAGHSVQGREIQAVRTGDPAAPRTVLAVGDVHGDEQAGRAVIRELRRRTPPAGVQVWTVASANPDGEAHGTRQNARGVDLNRNFPHRWRGGGRPFDVYYPGARAASEPETRAMRRLIRRLRPDVTVWFHQHLRLVTLVPGADAGIIRAYA